MKLLRHVFIGTAIIMLGFTTNANAKEDRDSSKAAKKGVNVPVTELQWTDTGIFDENGIGQLQVAPGFGDSSTGKHATFLKMPAGFVGASHSHTYDYYAVVITGVAINSSKGGKEIPLPAASYWFQRGGVAHVTKCISTTECIFFISQDANFDYVPDSH